jgi:hypothetical protein
MTSFAARTNGIELGVWRVATPSACVRSASGSAIAARRALSAACLRCRRVLPFLPSPRLLSAACLRLKPVLSSAPNRSTRSPACLRCRGVLLFLPSPSPSPSLPSPVCLRLAGANPSRPHGRRPTAYARVVPCRVRIKPRIPTHPPTPRAGWPPLRRGPRPTLPSRRRRGCPTPHAGAFSPARAGQVIFVDRFSDPPRGGEAIDHSQSSARRAMQIGSHGNRRCGVDSSWPTRLFRIVSRRCVAFVQSLT